MKRALLILVAMGAGCDGGQPPDLGAAQSASMGSGGGDDGEDMWTPEQGVHVLGAAADKITEKGVLGRNPYLSVSTSASSPSTVTLSLLPAAQGAHLKAVDGATTYSRNSPLFNGLILDASNGGQIKIDHSQTVTPDSVGFTGVADPTLESTEYFLKYLAPGADPNVATNWKDYCDPPADGEPEHGALPVLGRYTKNRVHTGTTTAISFACNWGISYKCTLWGFGAGNNPGDDRWKLHNACEGGGNARYCGDANSFTRERTPVWFVDNHSATQTGIGLDQSGFPYPITHPRPWPGNPDMMYIESAWKADGTPACISRLRWVSLPPKPCPGFGDPRFPPDPGHDSGLPAPLCDGMEIPELFSKLQATIVVASMRMDMPLGRWETADGTDRISTVLGSWVAAPDSQSDAATVWPPFVNKDGKPFSVFRGYDGMVLRNLPGTLIESTMVPLYMQTEANGDLHLAIGTGRTDPSFEGYILPSRTFVDSEYENIVGTSFYQCTWPSGDLDTHLGNQSLLRNCLQGSQLGYAFDAPAVPVPP